ncbi:MAG: toll/interleukin-1 receptor domain-containing protein, partial [Anaerolineae bacterium]|nr:toll/interleukin-1 receptor domain-containing protein [Anaerolineae bacterium]
MKIFVSYRSINRALVEGLISDLKDMEHEVWYDQELEGGQKWWDNILHQIRAAELLIFAMTPQSLESRPCQLE